MWCGQKTDLAVQLCAEERFVVKAVTETLGVACWDVVGRVQAKRSPRGPQTRNGGLQLTAEIQRFGDEHPTYGYCRIAALLSRERRWIARERQAGLQAHEEAWSAPGPSQRSTTDAAP